MSKRLDFEYEEFRKAVLKRDKRKCQMCDSKKKLQVHHIQTYSKCPHLRTEPSNGITLCVGCHKLIKGREKVYAQSFISIVLENENNI